MKTLEKLLQQVDGKSYPAYKDLRGRYDFKDYQLNIEHVQGDPFAAPSKLSVDVPGGQADFPAWTYETKEKRVALQDFLLRGFYQQTGRYTHKAKGSGKSGVMSVSRCGQEVLERTGCEVQVTDGSVKVRLEVGFPANGRRIQAGELRRILFEFLPVCVKNALYYAKVDQKKLEQTIWLAEDQKALRGELKARKLAAFIANGAVLPRESGVSDLPMKQSVVFRSPKELEVTLDLPHTKGLTGMGIPEGVTLIVGGGYHGKSTVLQALERGVYPHICGDGREYVVTDESAVKLRAEDGRNICSVDISGFISNLPNKKDTHKFSTLDASGSTSQAANVAEAVSAGARVLLIDEDTSATNFMVRDELMQRVVHRDKEPIIPYVERVRELYEEHGISTILVAGSSGAYFQVADTIVQMDAYVPYVITEAAKREAENFPKLKCDAKPLEKVKQNRVPLVKNQGNDSRAAGRDDNYRYGGYGGRGGRGAYGGQDGHVGRGERNGRGEHGGRGDQNRTKIKGLGRDGFLLNKEQIELRYVEQIVDGEQTQMLAQILNYMLEHVFDGTKNLDLCVSQVERLLREKGMAAVVGDRCIPGNLAMPRREEIYACVNRYRGLKVR
ncbi:ABC-ATPase domain-containing protein [Hespellia stercorisuis]|uniref:Predicted ATPase of the ABC class n=1 Tax=Hespellia stercorisuis DSM 15480 TaxID=1121950 RepID=A0A1M6IYR4_9FIRM|nr:ABC-ATPase domain-containing protein [Hespellia stercorisuis]SHJ39604.1 Predicted ATPase of the ABC class [Hespellia stercorisuis DSM 15480]